MYPTEVPPISVYAGDFTDFNSYTMKDSEGVPEDLSAYTDWRAQWRQTATAANALDLDVDTSQVAIGKFVVSAPDDITEQMDRDGVWDVQAVLNQKTRTFVYGKTTFRQDVTRVV